MPNDKIIWTEKELEKAMEEPLVREFPPLGHVTAGPFCRVEVTEISQVEGTITDVIVYLPPGVRDLVWVSVSLNNTNFVAPVGGDNQYHSILAASDIKVGDSIEVKVKNFCELRHTVGVRVDVKEPK